MSLGKKIRLARLFRPSTGRLFAVAVDHFIGYQDGLPAGLTDLPRLLSQIVAGQPDAVTMHKGPAMHCWPAHAGETCLIVQNLLGRPDDSADESIASPEDALRLGADAFATCAFVRGKTEAAHLRRVAEQVRQADLVGIPVILHIYPRKYEADGSVSITHQSEDIAWAVRCGMEVGVDVIKTPYTGDPVAFSQIVASCPVPIVMAGGPRAQTVDQSLALVREAMAADARGATIGRNIWGFPDVTRSVQAFRSVVHGTGQ